MKVSIGNNERIGKWFLFESEEAPIEELKYVINQKLSFSFLDEVGSAIEKATLKAKTKNIKTSGSRDMAHNFGRFVILATEGMKDEDDKKLTEALESLRSIYQVAKDIDSL